VPKAFPASSAEADTVNQAGMVQPVKINHVAWFGQGTDDTHIGQKSAAENQAAFIAEHFRQPIFQLYVNIKVARHEAGARRSAPPRIDSLDGNLLEPLIASQVEVVIGGKVKHFHAVMNKFPSASGESDQGPKLILFS
jgi:hypothetical protein